MPRIAYVQGRYVPHHAAMTPIEDRGYQFSDGVYEVMAVYPDLGIVDEIPHLERLERSLAALHIAWRMPRPALSHILREVWRRNPYREGILYLQATRGVAPRGHAFPNSPTLPVLSITANGAKWPSPKLQSEGVRVITTPDIRWGRCDIKSISLLPNTLAKQEAVKAGAFEAWLVDAAGAITEGSSSNAYIVTREGTLRTHPATSQILAGITRARALHCAAALAIPVEETPFTLEDTATAAEAFLTSTTSDVLPVTRVGDTVIGDGTPGTVTQQLRKAYWESLRLSSAATTGFRV